MRILNDLYFGLLTVNSNFRDRNESKRAQKGGDLWALKNYYALSRQ